MCPDRPHMNSSMRAQSGFGLVSAVFLLVMLAVLGVSITFMSGTQRNAVVLDVLGSRAYQAARAGIEWGAFQAVQNNACAASTNLTFTGTSMAGFAATVQCTVTTTDEGGTTIRLYNIISNACNIPTGGACPNAASNSATYVERQVTAVVGG